MKGGKREGAGRKRLHDEIEAKELSTKAIISVYGSLQEGMESLLKSGKESLIKFVFEHAVGKPKEKIEHSSNEDAPVIFKLDDRFTKND